MLNHILNHLEYLVGCDTQNPPRAISSSSPIINYCARELESCGCTVVITDHADGCINILATRANARTIVNCHLDTVPADPTWTFDPFKLIIQSDRAIGLGACDIKGAAACILAAAHETQGPLAILFTTDEEAGQSKCVRSFLGEPLPYDQAVVAEPTHAQAVTEHRGLATFELLFHGTSAHSSIVNANEHNAVHLAAQWCSRALELTKSPPYDNICFNIGVFNGGTKPNVAASSATVLFGMRPPPGMNFDEPINALKSLINDHSTCTCSSRFFAPSLERSVGVDNLLDQFDIEPGEPVNFWTEAALFHQAGLTTIVLGPGSIEQAHAADEFVSLADLVNVCQAYKRIFSNSPSQTHSQHASAIAQGTSQS